MVGLDYMERAANAGDRASMVYLANAYDTGQNLVDPTNDRSISKALYSIRNPSCTPPISVVMEPPDLNLKSYHDQIVLC